MTNDSQEYQTIMFGFILTHPAFVFPEFQSLLSMTTFMNNHVASIQDSYASTQQYEPIKKEGIPIISRIPESTHWSESDAECASLLPVYEASQATRDRSSPQYTLTQNIA